MAKKKGKKKAIAKKPLKKEPAPKPSIHLQKYLQNGVPWLILCLSLVIFFVARINFIDIPLNRDEGSYSYLGKIALNGGIPYYDFYEMKPPGLFYFYGLTGGLFGFGVIGMRLSILVINLINALGVFFIAQRLYKHRPSSLIASGMYLMFSLSSGIFGHSLVAEQAVLLFAIPAFYFILGDKTRKNLVLAGVFIAISMTMKQSAIFYLMSMMAYLVWDSRQSKNWVKQVLQRGLWFFIPIVALGLLTLLLMLLIGDWSGMIYWLFNHAQSYASINTSGRWLTLLQFFGTKFLLAQWPILLIFGIAFIYYFFLLKRSKDYQFLIPLLICSILTITPGARFYSQYWALLLPVMSLLCGSMIYRSWDNPKLKMSLPVLIIGLIGAEFFISKDYYLVKDRKRTSEIMYTGNPFTEIEQLCDYLNRIKQPSETLFVLGSEPQAYLYTNTVAPSRHVFHGLITSNTTANKVHQEEALNDLRSARPDYVLFNYVPFSWSMQEGGLDKLYNDAYYYVVNNYKPIAVADYGPGGSNLVYQDRANEYEPTSRSFIVLYKRTN